MGRKAIHILFLSFICGFTACTKEENDPVSETFIRQVSSDADFASHGIIPLDDGNYVLAGFEYHAEVPVRRNSSRLLKMDGMGNVIWDKQVTQTGTTLYKLLPLSGTGFITLGVTDFNSTCLALCVFDYDGDLLSEHSVSLHAPNSNMSPFDMIQLSNGNYAIAGSDNWTGSGILTILDPGFDSLTYREFVPPDSNHYLVRMRSLCETAGGKIALAANTNSIASVYTQQTAVIQTTLDGNQSSFNILADSLHNQTPYSISLHNNELIIPSVSYSLDWQAGYGCEVNYDLDYDAPGLGCGRIHIQRYSDAGTLVEQTEITGYPRNGLIHSMHPTRDGGFICCGTVDQADSYYMLSHTKMYLLKLDANLNMEWSKTIHTAYQSFGVEAIQVPDGGYLVCGFHRSMDSRFQMLVIKTDSNGNY